MLKLPQEIIDEIILKTEISTIIKIRHLLSSYAYKKSMNITINDMIKHGDIEGLEYNMHELEKCKETIINRIVVFSEPPILEKLLLWAYKNQFRHNQFTFKIMLIKNDKETTKYILNYFYSIKYKFHTYYYNMAIHWSNEEVIHFLKSKYIRDNPGITEDTIYKKNIKLFKMMLNYNLIDLTKAFRYIALTQDKKYIKKVARLVPIHLNTTIKFLQKNNIPTEFIRWLLEYTLFLDNNNQLSENIYLLTKIKVYTQSI